MRLKLVKLEACYKKQLFEMMEEWEQVDEKIVPYSIRKNDYRDFNNYMDNLEVRENTQGKVPDSTYFCLDEERNIFVGAVNIRHYLNESLLKNGGHIGDGVRPSERRKGIATQMIALALLECKKLGMNKVLMVCDKNNIGSAKSIQNNGGVLENEIEVDGLIEQRYWIDLQNELLQNMSKIHTTKLGVQRIKKNLSLVTDEVVEWCKAKVVAPNACITREGKNWYVSVDNCIITINAYSYTIITAHSIQNEKVYRNCRGKQ